MGRVRMVFCTVIRSKICNKRWRCRGSGVPHTLHCLSEPWFPHLENGNTACPVGLLRGQQEVVCCLLQGGPTVHYNHLWGSLTPRYRPFPPSCLKASVMPVLTLPVSCILSSNDLLFPAGPSVRNVLLPPPNLPWVYHACRMLPTEGTEVPRPSLAHVCPSSSALPIAVMFLHCLSLL